jgi:ribosome-binding ATPase YchF (GTP1/OBG family)
MKIGLVGYQGSGKSSLFEWLTGVAPDPSRAHTSQSAMAVVPDERVKPLCDIYHPKKITLASIELVDTPGLSRTHEGNAAKLALIREAACLIFVVASFDGSNAMSDLQSFREDLLLADLEIVSGRAERLRDSVKRPRPNREEHIAELAAIEPLLATLEAGQSLDPETMTDEQKKATRSFCLFSQKPRLGIVNLGDDDADGERFAKQAPEGIQVIGVPIGIELELSKMSEEERQEFRAEMGVGAFDRDALIRTIMDVSGQMLFFTAGEKEVRTWMTHKGTTAVEAAEGIHTDLARGFIRAETMTCDDLMRLGSEREVKAHNLVRQEPKDYVVRDGDILNIKFSV